jgi:hypothetical protein
MIYPHDGTTTEIIASAAPAMYRAKLARRNRYCLASVPDETASMQIGQRIPLPASVWCIGTFRVPPVVLEPIEGSFRDIGQNRASPDHCKQFERHHLVCLLSMVTVT